MNRTLHVLHVIGGGDTGGAMTHLLPLAGGLTRLGCDVHLACLGEGGLAEEARARGLSVNVLPMRRAWDPLVLAPLRHLLSAGSDMAAPKRAAPGSELLHGATWDVVHTHGMRANIPVRTVFATLRSRPCLFTTVHSDLQLDYRAGAVGRAYRALDKASLSLVNTIICVSDSLRALLVSRGYPSDCLAVVRSGLDRDTEQALSGPAEDRLGGVRAREQSPCIGTVARLVRVKDLDLLLQAAALVRSAIPDLRIIVVGDGPEKAHLEQRANELGIKDVVWFVGTVARIGPWLEKMDVYVVTSLYEGGVSMAVLEAMAVGLPVVAAAAGGVSEAVVDGVTGFVIPREDDRQVVAARLADRITQLLADRRLLRSLGSAGRQRVHERFLVQQAAAATLRLYERCAFSRVTSY